MRRGAANRHAMSTPSGPSGSTRPVNRLSAPWWLQRIWLPILILVASLGITYSLWTNARENALRELQQDFAFQVRETNARIQQRLQTYEEILRGTRGLFMASPAVKRADFKRYVSALRLEEHYPGIQAVVYAMVVPPAQREKHIAAIRRQGFSDYTIFPSGKRATYTTIIYLEPFSGRNLGAFGYDMFSEPVRRAALEQTRDSG